MAGGDSEFCFAVVSVIERARRFDVVLLCGIELVFQSVWIDVSKLDRKQTS